jgi:hypothetical protein
LADLPELRGVRMVWFSDWYDGPITGLAAYEGREHWFVMVTDDDGEHWDFDPRIYLLHQLTPEQVSQEWRAHRSFAAAGMPGCLHAPPCAVATDPEPLDALWERWPPEREEVYQDQPAIGWFSADPPGA